MVASMAGRVKGCMQFYVHHNNAVISAYHNQRRNNGIIFFLMSYSASLIYYLKQCDVEAMLTMSVYRMT